MTLKPGDQLGPYEIEDTLGVGGMGEVYRAHDPRLRRSVALKILPPELALDSERSARFKREAPALAFAFAQSHDGRQLAVARGAVQSDVGLIQRK